VNVSITRFKIYTPSLKNTGPPKRLALLHQNRPVEKCLGLSLERLGLGHKIEGLCLVFDLKSKVSVSDRDVSFTSLQWCVWTNKWHQDAMPLKLCTCLPT